MNHAKPAAFFKQLLLTLLLVVLAGLLLAGVYFGWQGHKLYQEAVANYPIAADVRFHPQPDGIRLLRGNVPDLYQCGHRGGGPAVCVAPRH